MYEIFQMIDDEEETSLRKKKFKRTEYKSWEDTQTAAQQLDVVQIEAIFVCSSGDPS